MKNYYKRRDVFKCSQEAHRHFQGRVSVYHVLKEKGCYPQGCLYFIWHCQLMEKGRSCKRGFNWVGSECRGCDQYVEEKVHLQPRLMLNEAEYARFLDEFEDYELWLDSILLKRLPVAGRIAAVKPWLESVLTHHHSRLRLLGYLAVLREGFIGLERFEDPLYLRLSPGLMEQHRLRPGLKVELQGEIRLDRGRLVVNAPKAIETSEEGSGDVWTREKALVAVRTATRHDSQPEPCLDCRWGVLVDGRDRRGHSESRFRSLYCLKGVREAAGCYLKAVPDPHPHGGH